MSCAGTLGTGSSGQGQRHAAAATPPGVQSTQQGLHHQGPARPLLLWAGQATAPSSRHVQHAQCEARHVQVSAVLQAVLRCGRRHCAGSGSGSGLTLTLPAASPTQAQPPSSKVMQRTSALKALSSAITSRLGPCRTRNKPWCGEQHTTHTMGRLDASRFLAPAAGPEIVTRCATGHQDQGRSPCTSTHAVGECHRQPQRHENPGDLREP